ncbi:MAG: ATP-binding protein [Chloroflexi bacterium]|nr:ATP-binding protein [Chloroflexota bacterium]
MSQERRRWELTIDARQSSLGEVADFIEEVCATLGLDEDTAFAVQLATDEACQNAVEHSCRYAEDEEVTVACEVAASDLMITISDRGVPFDLAKVRPPRLDAPLEKRNNGGLGIYFMRQMMDEVHWARDSDGVNTVTMIKRGAIADE